MDQGSPAIPRRTNAIVLGVVIIGLALLTAGILLALQRKGSGPEDPARTQAWCALRREWAQRVDALIGDILLHATQQQHGLLSPLLEERRLLGVTYGEQLRTLVESDAALWNRVQAVEVALLKEGKVRSNIAVEIHNATTNLALDNSTVLRRDEATLATQLAQRSKEQRAALEAEVAAALAPLHCTGIYRGSLPVGEPADDPNLSWEELDIRRAQALQRVRSRLVALEPLEQYASQVQQALLQRYRGPLKVCYQRAQAQNPDIARTLGLRIRLRQDGRIQTLGLEWMEPRDERILDCLLQAAGNWRLPRPSKEGDAVVVALDFATL